ncbi:cytochrome c oxidase subunit 3 family protein [sulfur-oxidizing endosymbiont of Gigantopelta aegis]|uniref:cytochrome c oxidase subunit 3 family protein n=1 Tax=sulfur-oxidizing endosymbiont of Gigantopelta aegis TaxID=2794934 RepID=UPI0018DC068E|nr:cytochrome c oxidase subunit 3 family protein [sulfur-oxidizing endosymbiont of Gigantopelta aegis]
MSIGSIKADNKILLKKDPLPGDLAIWFFIMAELLVFGLFFMVYVYVRNNNVELFNTYQLELHRIAGVINTIALITSSYFVALSVHAIKQDQVKRSGHLILLALAMGAVFVVVKLWEYSHVFGAGIHLSTNTFYTFYISLTFFHFMHVLMGMVILGAVYRFIRQGKYSASEHLGIETGASYWHMVDLVWIILFPLVYVIR